MVDKWVGVVGRWLLGEGCGVPVGCGGVAITSKPVPAKRKDKKMEKNFIKLSERMKKKKKLGEIYYGKSKTMTLERIGQVKHFD